MAALISQSLLALAGFLIYLVLRTPKKNLPPGPKGLPLVGNILDLPPKGSLEHEHWASITAKYGPISSVTMLGQPIIFIADKEAAQDILGKNSAVTSARPVFHYSNYCGYGNIISMHQLNQQFKSERKIVHRVLGTKALVAKYADIQELEARRLLLRILKEPQHTFKHFETEASAILLKILYGYTVDPHQHDPLVELIDRTMFNFTKASTPFGRLIEFIPAIKWLPEGFPGTGFKTEAKPLTQELLAAVNEPYNFVRKQMINRNRITSYVAKLIHECIGDADEPSDADVHAIKWSAASLQLGAEETTVSNLICFIFVMMAFPEAQKRAQEEIDRVTGGTRLPALSDREQMPFVDAIVSEVLRWLTIAPMGVPHVLSEDMSYNGYDLPKGAYLIPTAWDFAHDASVYADPERFAPERFLEPRTELDPRWLVFGFGRRVCPGQYLAESVLFVTFAHIIAVFNIGKPTDEQGNVMEPKLELETGLIARPKPFPFKITPRSERHVEEMIKAIERDHPWEEGDASQLGELPRPRR